MTRAIATLALTGAALGLLISTVQAQESETLLSNTGQAADTHTNTDDFYPAQGFITGSKAGGYVLTSIELDVATAPGTPSGATVELWSSMTMTDIDGNEIASEGNLEGPVPDARVARLTHSTGTWTTGLNTFNAPSDTHLLPKTTYFVYVSYAAPAPHLQITNTDLSSTDSGGASGWQLPDGGSILLENGIWLAGPTSYLKFKVNGYELRNRPGAIYAYWTDSETQGSNLQNNCAGTEPFRAFWERPKSADEWEAEVTPKYGASDARFNIRYLGDKFHELTGTVRIQDGESGSLSIRVRGRFGNAWGAWSPVTSLSCIPPPPPPPTCPENAGDVWCGVITVGESMDFYGFNTFFDSGELSDDDFDVGTSSYTINSLGVQGDTEAEDYGALTFDLAEFPNAEEQAALDELTLYLDNDAFRLSEARDGPPGFYYWVADLNWSREDYIVARLREASSSQRSLRGRFVSPPERHDGEKRIKVRVEFSEAPENVGADGVEVEGGAVTSVRSVAGQAPGTRKGTRSAGGRNAGQGDREVVWEIEIEPDSDGDVTVSLAAWRPCDETGAICTADGRTLSTAISTTVRGPEESSDDPGGEEQESLTARFEGMPAEHDGESAFTLRMAFSEPLSWMNGRRLREDVVAVSGGRATKGKRVNRRRDLWQLTVEPDSPADVTVTLAAGAACDSPAAVCTADGRSLSEGISTTVRGPAADEQESPATGQDQDPGQSVSEGDTDLPNDNTTPGRVAVGGSATGTIGTAGDQDRFAVDLEAGRTYRFDLTGRPGGGGTLPDTYFRAIYNSEGRYQSGSYNDDFDGGRDSRVTFTPTQSETCYARVSGDRNETGTYTLSVTDITAGPASKPAVADGPPGLAPNAPNPFNANTVIPYRLDADGPVRLEIYNLLGQRIRTLVDEAQTAGVYRVHWDARDAAGRSVATGIYFTRLHYPGGVHTRRMLYLE